MESEGKQASFPRTGDCVSAASPEIIPEKATAAHRSALLRQRRAKSCLSAGKLPKRDRSSKDRSSKHLSYHLACNWCRVYEAMRQRI
ncbi:hypothetical protein [Brasilonema sp. UFV-L1]|uniref:hypothetical protein n=1 Tax=Brasilonema sp. UFV-L1 TaxID=2234130 RepID=UPI00145DCD41|nr:hypothetical protein [Brasilonema sp. UFV-L1]